MRAARKTKVELHKEIEELQSQVADLKRLVSRQEGIEHALQESQTLYRELYDRTPVMMHSINDAGKIVSVNNYWLEVSGYERDEVIGKRSVDFLDKDSRRRALSDDIPLLQEVGWIKERKYRLVKKNDDIIDVELSATCKLDDVGKIAHTFAFMFDVTEKQRMEDKLRRGRDELEAAVEVRTAELSNANEVMREQFAEKERAEELSRRYTKRVETLHGIDRAILEARSPEAIGDAAIYRLRGLIPCLHTLIGVFEPDGGVTILAAYCKSESELCQGMRIPAGDFEVASELEQDEVQRVDDAQSVFQTPLRRLLVREKARSWIGVPLRASGNLIGILHLDSEKRAAFSNEQLEIAREVADSVAVGIQQTRLLEQVKHHATELEERVSERTAELEAFSYSISHDLRTPLRAIDGFARLLQEDHAGQLDREGRRLLDVVRDSAENMSQLIDDLLTFFGLSRKEMHGTKIEMYELAEEVFEELRVAVGKPRLRIDLKPLPPTYGDRSMMRQVFVNLLSNAIKFSGPKPTPIIEVGHEQTDGGSVYYVRDNGVGFDARYADKLFGVFQQLHTGDAFEGTGVGLAIVHRIIQRHEGRVWAEGALNEGATVFFTLPS